MGIRTMPYSLEEMIQIVTIRANTESLTIGEDAVAALGEIGSRTSLRHAVQLLTPSRIMAETQGRTEIEADDVEEIDVLFFDQGLGALAARAGRRLPAVSSERGRATGGPTGGLGCCAAAAGPGAGAFAGTEEIENRRARK